MQAGGPGGTVKYTWIYKDTDLNGDTDTEGDLDVGPAQRLSHRSVDLLNAGSNDVSALTVRIREEQHEFVATESVGLVADADRETEQVGDFFEQFVADTVTQMIIDLLEAVDVQHHHRHAPARPRRRAQPGRKLFLQRA